MFNKLIKTYLFWVIIISILLTPAVWSGKNFSRPIFIETDKEKRILKYKKTHKKGKLKNLEHERTVSSSLINSPFRVLPLEIVKKIMNYEEVYPVLFATSYTFLYLGHDPNIARMRILDSVEEWENYLKPTTLMHNFPSIKITYIEADFEKMISVPIIINTLKKLNISNLNKGGGKYVSPIEALTNLTLLDISENSLKGHCTILKSLTNLTSLDVSCNGTEEHFSTLKSLSNLTSLDIKYNLIKKSCNILKFFTNLTFLNISCNGIREHVTVLRDLKSLTYLDVSDNNIKEYCLSLTTLTNLTSLNIGFNLLREYYAALSTLTNLTSLNLISNDIGKHCIMLKHFTSLAFLNISYNGIGEHVTILRDLKNLTYLDVSGNNINPYDLPCETFLNKGCKIISAQNKE